MAAACFWIARVESVWCAPQLILAPMVRINTLPMRRLALKVRRDEAPYRVPLVRAPAVPPSADLPPSNA